MRRTTQHSLAVLLVLALVAPHAVTPHAVAAPAGNAAVRSAAAAPAARDLSPAALRSYLFDAARAGDVELLSSLAKRGVDIEATDSRGFTALILAAYAGQSAAVDALLALGADPNHADPRGNTPLMGAIFKGEDKIAGQLIADARTQVDQRNGAGQTAAMFAALFGRETVIAQLRARGADLAAADAAGQTAENLARQQGNAAMADRLKTEPGK